MLGVLLNILLFLGKYAAGKISGSVSIMADAFNNLTDAGTVCMSALGIKVASIGMGKRHPKGHGKFEWIVALITSLSVFMVGWELLIDSFHSIKNPVDTVFSWLTFAILLVSILVKVFLYVYNTQKSKSQNALSLKAVALDSLSDAFSTTAVLLALLLNHWFGWQLDGWFGLAVSLLIMFNSLKSAAECINRLVDKAVPQEQLDELVQTVKAFFPKDIPMYDIELSDCGMGQYNTSFHLVSTEDTPILELARIVPRIEEALKIKFGYISVIQIEEAVDSQTQAAWLDKVRSSMKAAGFPYTLSEARVIHTTNQRLQLVMTVLVPFLTKEQMTQFSAFISDKVALGLEADDSTLITIRLGGYHLNEKHHGKLRKLYKRTIDN